MLERPIRGSFVDFGAIVGTGTAREIGRNLTGRFSHVLLIAVPFLVEVYFNSALA